MRRTVRAILAASATNAVVFLPVAFATEGAMAKLLATEVGNAAAEAAIQAHGGYGYVREYEVEKIKRDVRITTMYEGT